MKIFLFRPDHGHLKQRLQKKILSFGEIKIQVLTTSDDANILINTIYQITRFHFVVLNCWIQDFRI